MSAGPGTDRTPRVRAYVAEVCAAELADEAVSAAFVDFLARSRDQPVSEEQVDGVLLAATRSATAGRMLVVPPAGKQGSVVTAECRAMPELLALHAEGGESADEQLIVDHLAGCAVCAHTLDRIQRAERGFARAVGELPTLELGVTTLDLSKARPPATKSDPRRGRPKPLPEHEGRVGDRSAAAASAAPLADSESSGGRGAPPPGYRRRSGGVVGAIRKLGRPAR